MRSVDRAISNVSERLDDISSRLSTFEGDLGDFSKQLAKHDHPADRRGLYGR
ncbi:MAG: hypothetical protein M3415_04825 [Actinomycetota bacterium]|nr:hypothetical protein [Actinomycetota bacterium]